MRLARAQLSTWVSEWGSIPAAPSNTRGGGGALAKTALPELICDVCPKAHPLSPRCPRTTNSDLGPRPPKKNPEETRWSGEPPIACAHQIVPAFFRHFWPPEPPLHLNVGKKKKFLSFNIEMGGGSGGEKNGEKTVGLFGEHRR